MIAFEKQTGRLLWWDQTEKGLIDYRITPLGIVQYYDKKDTLTFQDPKNGRPTMTIELPAPFHPVKDKFHVAPSGICYFISRIRILFIGKIQNNEWKTVSKQKTPPGSIHFYEDMVCFKSESKYLIDQTGKRTVFDQCHDIVIHDRFLYKISKTPHAATKLLLTVEKIKKGPVFRIKKVLSSLLIPYPEFKIKSFLKDSLCQAIYKKDDKHYLSLIDIDKQRIKILQEINPSRSKILSDYKTKTLFCLTDDNILRKHTYQKSIAAAKVKNYDQTRLIYVDENEELYISSTIFPTVCPDSKAL